MLRLDPDIIALLDGAEYIDKSSHYFLPHIDSYLHKIAALDEQAKSTDETQRSEAQRLLLRLREDIYCVSRYAVSRLETIQSQGLIDIFLSANQQLSGLQSTSTRL